MTSVSSDITTNTNNDSSMLLVDHSQSTVSTTLADLPFTLDIPLLRRRDLEVGPLLGKGRYSQVHSITSIRFPSSTTTTSTTNGEYRDHRNDAGTSDNDDTNQTAEQQRQEQQPRRRYVMKHLQNKLFENRTHRRFAKDLTNALADLVLEAMYLSKLRHPNIITLRGLTLGGTSVLKRKGAVADDYFLILDQLDQTLDRRIHQTWKQKNDNTVELVLTKTRYALQIADALSYLHDHQVIYRDLKPENCGLLFYTSTTAGAVTVDDVASSSSSSNQEAMMDDILQLFDFGLARELDEPAENTTRLYSLSASGTRRYMAAEIFNPPGKYNYKADTYSFAMVFYEMLSLRKPFADFTCQLHDELVCRLGGRPRLDDITWPHDQLEDISDNSNNKKSIPQMDPVAINTSRRLAKDLEGLLHQAWNHDPYQRLSMVQVYERLQGILEAHDKRKSELERIHQLHVRQQQQQQRSGASSLQQHFLSQTPEISIFLKKKTSTSELTVATDPMASDSELDDDNSHIHQQGRLSNSSHR